jgi:hypothetical protein
MAIYLQAYDDTAFRTPMNQLPDSASKRQPGAADTSEQSVSCSCRCTIYMTYVKCADLVDPSRGCL